MRNLVELIKQIAAGVYEAEKPMEIGYGTVQSIRPFTVRLDQKRTFGKEKFIVRQGITAQSFRVGERLILIQVQGGQEWLILDRKGAL